MQGVKDQYILALRIGGISVDKKEIEKVVITTRLSVVPKFEIQLKSYNKTLINAGITPASTVTLSIRKNASDAGKTHELQIARVKVFPDATTAGTYLFIITGFPKLYNKFLNSGEIRCHDNKTAVDAVIAAFDSAGIPCTTKAKSSDNMNWIQFNNTYQNFINNTLLHSGSEDALFLLAMHAQKCKIIDVQKAFNDKRVTTFASLGSATNANIIIYNSCVLDDNSGMSANFDVANKSIFEEDFSTGAKNKYTSTSKKYKAKELYEIPDFQKYYQNRSIDKDNMHSNYNKYFTQNIARINSMNSIDISLSTNGEIPAEIRDTIEIGLSCRFLLVNPEITTVGAKQFTGETDNVYSGDYLISKRSEIFENSVYTEMYGLSREGVKQI